MARPPQEGLTARESQIMEVIWTDGEASVEHIQAKLPTPLADSTIRTLLSIMAKKGYVDFRKAGKAKIFAPLIAREDAQKSALRLLADRLFGGSADLLLARLVEDEQVSAEELDRLGKKLRDRRR